MCAKFEGNLIMCLHFMAVFASMQKEEKKNKNKQLFEGLYIYISGTAGVIYFRFGTCSLQICQHLHSKFGLVWPRDHGATNASKIVLCSLC